MLSRLRGSSDLVQTSTSYMIQGKFNLLAFVSSSVKWGMITSVRTKWMMDVSGPTWCLHSWECQKEPCSSSFTRQAVHLSTLGNRWEIPTCRAQLYRCLCLRSEMLNRVACGKECRKLTVINLPSYPFLPPSLLLRSNLPDLQSSKYGSVSLPYQHTPCTIWNSRTRAQRKFISLCCLI